MRIHKEGYKALLVSLLIITLVNTLIYYASGHSWYALKTSLIFSGFLYTFFIHFFIRPSRTSFPDENTVYCPADGEIVVIEETLEPEYLKDKRIQVSIFMSIWDFHVNWISVPGTISYKKYYKGKYMLARNPKASLENERSTTVIKTEKGQEILFRQIAGAVARKISTFPNVGDKVAQNSELGFIKFGSRVDVLLPLGTKINVKIGDKVKGNETILAEL